MKKLPYDFKILKEISNVLNSFLSSPDTPVEIRSSELYDVIKKNGFLKSEFQTGRDFNQFLRIQHKLGNLKVFINYRVDTSNYNFFQWHFRKNNKAKKEDVVNNITYEGTYNYYKNSKSIIANDGTKLNSNQEVYIYEELKKHSNLIIKIEYPVSKFGETKFCDFKIKNTLNGKEYLWEHFGMTNNEKYKTLMVDKLEWYKKNGFKTVENGGCMIYTYYFTENRLEKDVLKFISIINS